MKRIYYNHETKVFGIKSDRVRKGILDWYKSNNLEDTEEYKDLLERKELLDYLESNPDEMYRPYGYAYSNDKTVNREFLRSPQGLKRNMSEFSPSMRKWVTYKEVNEGRNKTTNEFLADVVNRSNSMKDRMSELAESIPESDIKLYPELKDYIKSKDVTLTELPGEGTGYSKNKYTKLPEINIDPTDSSDSSAAHELQHYINESNGYIDSNKSLDIQNTLKNYYKESISDPDFILDYVHNVLEEEQSANRGKVMNSYLHGNKVNDDYLNKAYLKGKYDQGTYESNIQGYTPLPLRYEMNKDSVKKLKSKLRK